MATPSAHVSRVHMSGGERAVELAGTPGEEGKRPAEDEREEYQDEHAAGGVGRERVYRGQYAGTHEKRSEERQRKGEDGEQHRPALEGAAFFGNRERMNERGAGEPGHERGVLDRIRDPPAA